jgi:metal-dependent amidase/aminoacylase/carboxypeptidase family protein
VRVLALRLARDVAAGHGLKAEAEYVDGYPPTVNDGTEVAFAEQTLAAVLGTGRFVTAPDPQVLAEDFSFVLEQVPGAFVLLGACPPRFDPASAPYNHSPEAVFDDGVLADGTAIYAELALRRLAAG